MGCCNYIYSFCCKKNHNEEYNSDDLTKKKINRRQDEENKNLQANNNSERIRIPNNIVYNEDLERQFIRVKKNTKNFKIKSTIPMINLVHSDSAKNMKELKYNCPICLNFFNFVLVTSCCDNYICRDCADSYLATTIKYMTNIKCPLCSAEKNIILKDVDLNLPVNYDLNLG